MARSEPADERRGPGRPPRISHEDVVSAGLAMGIRDLTINGVARRLKVNISTLYGYVEGVDDLRAQVVDRVLERFEGSNDPEQDLLETTLSYSLALRSLLQAYPGLAAELIQRTPTKAHLHHRSLVAAIVERGVDELVAHLIADDVTAFTIAYGLYDYVPAPQSVSADDPPLPVGPDGAGLTDNDLFRWTAVAHLRGVLGEIEAGNLPWTGDGG